MVLQAVLGQVNFQRADIGRSAVQQSVQVVRFHPVVVKQRQPTDADTRHSFGYDAAYAAQAYYAYVYAGDVVLNCGSPAVVGSFEDFTPGAGRNPAVVVGAIDRI